ncbi:MAG TPA: dTDP-glucose 4,6-dehydratase [Dehalococcoidia bacterium]|nr:dTDP-glucose 4,6-dehydratase [Dehalococcoidia bacterium]
MLDDAQILVTGGCGFIGSNFILHLLKRYPGCRVVNLDKLTYASNPANLRDVEGDRRYHFVQGDICDTALVDELMAGADVVFNFAAESHVDRSLMEAGSFIQTDVLGTYVLLDAARRHSNVRRFVQVSTDEVYGDLPPGVYAHESDALHPRSPYAASKAGGDAQCIAFFETYGVPVIITRAANNIGPRQHVEKAVPLFVTSALQDQPLPLYGDGRQVRDWLYVEDHCRALDLAAREGEPGEVYNIGADNHQENIEVAKALLQLLEKPLSLIHFVEDRKGHDRRYAVDASKLRALGWAPEHDFASALERTVRWYQENRWWWEPTWSSPAFRDYYDQQYGQRLAAGVPYGREGGSGL